MSKNTSTMADVADYAKVSRMTVSRIVNGRGGVGQETVDRVREAIQQLGYSLPAVENRRGRNPKSPERKGLIAFAAVGLYESTLRTDVYHEISLAVEHVLARHGFGMVTRRLPPGSEQQLDLNLVDGAIVLVRSNEPVSLGLGVPFVQVLGLRREGEHWDHITYDDYHVGVFAAEHLLEKGHREAAMICGYPTMQWPRHRGFVDTMKRAGGDVVVPSHQGLYRRSARHHDIDPDGLAKCLKSCFEKESPLRAVFFDADMVTAAAYPRLYSMGIVPDGDVDIISCNQEATTLSVLRPRPPSIGLHLEQIAETAVDCLLERIENPLRAVQSIEYKPERP